MSQETPEERKVRKKAYLAAYYLANRDRTLAEGRHLRAAARAERMERTKDERAEKARISAIRRAEKKHASDKLNYAANAEELKAGSRAYYAENKDRLRAKALERYHTKKAARIASGTQDAFRIQQKTYKTQYHSTKGRATIAAYKKANNREMKRKKAAYRAKYPEKGRADCHARRAKVYNAPLGNRKLIADWERKWKAKKRVICYWCKDSFSPKRCQTDHIIPLAEQGPHSVENLCIACGPCNGKKNAKPLSRWNADIQEPVLL